MPVDAVLLSTVGPASSHTGVQYTRHLHGVIVLMSGDHSHCMQERVPLFWYGIRVVRSDAGEGSAERKIGSVHLREPLQELDPGTDAYAMHASSRFFFLLFGSMEIGR